MTSLHFFCFCQTDNTWHISVLLHYWMLHVWDIVKITSLHSCDNLPKICCWFFHQEHILTLSAHVLSCDFRYLLYDVNPPEGFNLRRDVYIRMASLVKTLRKNGDDWVLVLPPWGRLYHWQSLNIYQIRIPWGEFFSLTSLQANVPVIEYEEFVAGKILILVTQNRITYFLRLSFVW